LDEEPLPSLTPSLRAFQQSNVRSIRFGTETIFAATPLFMGVAAIKFKNGDMEAMGKNLGGAVCLFLVPKIIEVILAWAAQ
jgi:hypothetical protein